MYGLFDDNEKLAKLRVEYEEVKVRLKQNDEAVMRSASTTEVNQFTEEARALAERKNLIEENMSRLEMLIGIADGTIPGKVIASYPSNDKCVLSIKYPGIYHQDFPDSIKNHPGKNHDLVLAV